MVGLLLRGAFGNLGDAENVDHFDFHHMVVGPSLPYGRRRIKVACDGEVSWLRWLRRLQTRCAEVRRVYGSMGG